MAGKKFDGPKGYIEVKDRLPQFFAKYPEGSLTGSYELVTMNGNAAVIYTAKAYRTPDDKVPAVGTAYEPIPGATQFTRGSEIQNAETAAWGRAMIATGAVSAQEGIASADELRSRAEDTQRKNEDALATWQAAIDERTSRQELLELYAEAQKQQAGKPVLDLIKAAGEAAK